MKTSFTLPILCVTLSRIATSLALLFIALPNNAFSQSPITTVSINSVSSEYPGIEASHLLTSDGFGSGNPATFTNVYLPGDIWETMPYQVQGTNWIIFDLGASYDLASFHVWNLNILNYTGRGISSMTLLTSNNGTTYTNQGTLNLTQGTGSSDYSGQDFNAPWTNVRFVEFAGIYSFQNGGDDAGHMGLSKVQFTAVPEPASLVMMLGFGILGATLVRQRKV